jgi:hypothetical protein
MPEIPRWKVQAALRLLGLDPDQMLLVEITRDDVSTTDKDGGIDLLDISDTIEDSRLHLLAMLPAENWSELGTVDEDELKYFTGPKLHDDGLTTYANGTMVLIVKRRP